MQFYKLKALFGLIKIMKKNDICHSSTHVTDALLHCN